MNWQEYEEITKHIYETLGKKSGVKIIGHGKDCKVKGKSGVEHQIDVLTSHSDGIHNYKTAIECKYWKDTVNKDIVMKVAEVVEDAGINKGVIVSKNGFTNDGKSFAAYKNIGLIELREMREEDWEGRPRIIHVKSEVRRPVILNFIIDNTGPNELRPEEVLVDVVKVKLLTGEEIPLVNYIKTFEESLQKEDVNKVIVKTFVLKGAKLINSITKSIVLINGFTFRGMLKAFDAGLKFHPIDEIWLIMKSIFEDKSFTISKNRIIREDKK